MIDGWQLVTILAALVGAAISGGAFFAFSNFVMPALSELPVSDAVSAMQAINRAAPNPAFVTAIVGSALVAIPAVVTELGGLDASDAGFLLVGVVLSVVSLVITLAFNIPRNNALDRLEPGAATTDADWARYLTTWTRANTLRTLASLASAAAYALSLRGG